MRTALPRNIAVLAALDLKGEKLNVVEKALKGAFSCLEDTLVAFGQQWKLRVAFSEPVDVRCRPYWSKKEPTEDGYSRTRYSGWKKTDTHVFSRLFNEHKCPLCYLPARNGRKGYHFPSLDKVVSYEVVLKEKKKNKFESYQEFKARFDLRYITESLIRTLWNGTSSQHGGKYCPADFHRLGPIGVRLVQELNRKGFKGVSDSYNIGSPGNPVLRNELCASHRSWGKGNFGRDIRVTYDGRDRVIYSSEYPGCGNGRYGLLATNKTFLWLEDD